MKEMWWYLKAFMVTSLVLFLLVGVSFADIPKDVAIHCVVNEGGNQGEKGMALLFHALLNRGTTKGVYGCLRDRFQPMWVYGKAERIYREVKEARAKGIDLVKGASFWESKYFPVPYWAKDMIITVDYKDHVFYKEVR